MHEFFTRDQNKKIKEFINLALEFNKTHNIFVRKDYEEVFQKDVFQNNEPKLQLKSSQLIYLISVIAVFCLIYYIIVM